MGATGVLGARLIIRRFPIIAVALLATLGTAQAQLVGHGGMVKGVAVSGDGARVASAGFDYSVMLWDLKAAAAVSLMHGHEAAVNAVAFTPDGLRVVSGGDDGKVLLWRLGQGAPERVMSGHRGRVAAVAVAPDGRVAASAAWDRTVRVVGSGDWGAGCGTDGACRQCQCGGVYAGRFTGGQCGGGRDRSGLGAGGWAGGQGFRRRAAGQCAGADSRWQARGRGRDRRAGAGLGSGGGG